ncbi:ECF RNA polymerase sigma factor SigJ [Anatilimnocola aggregata]|uniref:ECF RNA polymerase sigma factor SigJ n=1 Tax=Anatilimnocola aggregata TaxID=2528021 RepID=A0A517YNB1_9BACT|nr:RNA polymerase sigma-70 factor [Anatilimnocola aggregata]QDU31720.1 ECF RNA polymerase sigma factor SigJ [Anatilimnocola aggregata]
MPDAMTAALADFETHRPDLTRLAYRILGSRADADDVLQEAYLRWSNADVSAVRTPRAFLSTIVTRLSIDRRREIDARKETYIGPWLPEPVVESEVNRQSTDLAESVSLALMHVLETLSPVERAAYLLRKIFDYDYAEIAETLEKSETNCRQLVSRAEAHVHAERPRFTASREATRRMSERFLAACATGELTGIVQLLSDDIVIFSDGGGKATAAVRPVVGVNHVSRFLQGISRKAHANASYRHVLVNGEPGIAVFHDAALVNIIGFDLVDEQIRRIYFIRNPDKLARAQAELLSQ